MGRSPYLAVASARLPQVTFAPGSIKTGARHLCPQQLPQPPAPTTRSYSQGNGQALLRLSTHSPVQADDLVVGLQGRLLQGGEHACGDPLVVSALDGGCRVGGVGDLLIVRPRHQSLDELVEDDLFRGAGSVIPQRVGIDVDR